MSTEPAEMEELISQAVILLEFTGEHDAAEVLASLRGETAERAFLAVKAARILTKKWSKKDGNEEQSGQV